MDMGIDLWMASVALGFVYIIVVGILALAVRISRPKPPPRVGFQEIQGRAVRMRDVIAPAAAAAVLGFFVSLAASFVHANFSSPLAERLEVNSVTYLYLLGAGVLLAFFALILLVEKTRGAARDVTQHPATINRAAEAMLRGVKIEDLESVDLSRNLARWRDGRGKSALRLVFGRESSPNLNELFKHYGSAIRSGKLPRAFALRLYSASLKDFPTRGVLLFLVFGVPFWFTSVAPVVALTLGESGAALAAYVCIPVAFLFAQAGVTYAYLRANARFTARWYRIDAIELPAAEKRINLLVQAKQSRRDGRGAVFIEGCWMPSDEPS